ncbi:MAG: hypothetical protein A2X22_12915 [Bacteroidetes bacterium GWF2_49_14]|nr:MAG: hypothetical protein A2X22_12915 [Bacteroidetes bacterium GWF2_49_14]HBB92253.1 hypothetical protein [Bacteroidales bacterium]
MKKIWLIIVLLCGAVQLFPQSAVDILCKVLDRDSVPDITYVSTTLDLCHEVYQTDKEFLISQYVPTAISKAKTLTDIRSEAELYWYLGTYYWKCGNQAQAAQVYTDLRVESESNQYLPGKLNALNGLGNVNYLLGDYDKALSYYLEGLQSSSNDSVMLLKFYHNIANVYVLRNQLDSVIIYYNKSVEEHLRHQKWSDLSLVYQNISNAYAAQEKQKETRQYLDLALEAAEKSGDPRQIASVYQAMGLEVSNRHPDLAIRYLNLSIEYGRKANAFQLLMENLLSLAEVYANQGMAKNAYNSVLEASLLQDSLAVIEDSINLSGQEQSYRFRMEEIAMGKATRQHELEQLKASNRQRMIILILALALIGMIPLSLVLYQNYKIKVRMNQTRDKFFSLIAHDLKNPISGLAGLISVMNEEAHHNGEPPAQKRRIEGLSNSVARIQELLDNLLDWSRAENGQIAFQPEELDLSLLIKDVKHLYEDSLMNKGQNLIIDIPPDMHVMADANMLRSIIRNLVSNAIKFSPEMTDITLEAFRLPGEIRISVTDTGIGIDEEMTNRLFEKGTHYTSKGTREETGTGLGIKICSEFVRRHGGRIWVESKKGEGASFYFTLPDIQSSRPA